MVLWNQQVENITREEIEQLQLERLQATVNRVYRSVAFYREIFDEKGIVPEDIDSLSKLSILPFTSKKTLIENYPYGMFAVPLREVVRLQCTSGPEGQPIVIGYTRNDINHWTDISARILAAGGIDREDIVQICLDYGLFGGGIGFHYGAELIGASVIPGPDLDPVRQLLIMRDYRTTALISTPSFALKLIAAIKEKGISLANLNLKIGILTGEPLSESTRSRIEEELRIKVISSYGPSEIPGPKVATECEKRSGLHIFEDQFIPEIIDPRTGEVLPFGEEGELVLTTITKEAFPLIRYRTGDLTFLDQSPCSCGRSLIRMHGVTGRTDDMVIVNGVGFFPTQINRILAQVEGAEPHFRLIIDREGTRDVVNIMVEVSESIFFDEMKKLQQLKVQIEEKIYQVLGIKVNVKLVEKDSLSEVEPKKVVVDRRLK
ncbi:phenylacetate--CoA ligase [Candidatus Aerophobetes bacterium]|nr:phenylacetate--CoA ligase [Candidatus Aerophobetes bacterium]